MNNCNRTFKFIDSAVWIDEKLYFISGGDSNLIALNIDTLSVELILHLDVINPGYWSLYYINDRLYCIPRIGVRIAIFELKVKKIQYVESGDSSSSLVDIIPSMDSLFFIPRELPGALSVFDIEKQKFYKMQIWDSQIRAIGIWGRVSRWNRISDECIWLSFSNSERVICYDIKAQKVEEIVKPQIGIIKDCLSINNVCFAIAGREECHVYRWNQNSMGEVDMLDIKDPIKLIRVGNNLLVETNEGVCSIVNDNAYLIYKTLREENQMSSVIKAIEIGRGYLLLPWAYSTWILVSRELTQVCSFEIKYPVNEILKYEGVIEEGDITIRDFIDSFDQSH